MTRVCEIGSWPGYEERLDRQAGGFVVGIWARESAFLVLAFGGERAKKQNTRNHSN